MPICLCSQAEQRDQQEDHQGEHLPDRHRHPVPVGGSCNYTARSPFAVSIIILYVW